MTRSVSSLTRCAAPDTEAASRVGRLTLSQIRAERQELQITSTRGFTVERGQNTKRERVYLRSRSAASALVAFLK